MHINVVPCVCKQNVWTQCAVHAHGVCKTCAHSEQYVRMQWAICMHVLAVCAHAVGTICLCIS